MHRGEEGKYRKISAKRRRRFEVLCLYIPNDTCDDDDEDLEQVVFLEDEIPIDIV